tara:strand:+ start:175 stop:507 length:333 start_codon:yes stop_codon:yes gene_type:complete
MSVDDRVVFIHKKIRQIRIFHLKKYGMINCDISNYENYTMQELVNEFCSVVPCFFKSYDELADKFENHFKRSNSDMVQLCADLLTPPAAQQQAKLAHIVRGYFIGLPWIG